MKRPHVCILQTSFAKRDDTVAYLSEHVPGVRVAFITDSTLLEDIRSAGGPTESVIERMRLYARAAELSGADLILNSCSTVGEVADIYRNDVSIPVMKIDEPMAMEAARLGSKVALVATVETTLPPSERMIVAHGKKLGKEIVCDRYLEQDAFAALQNGDRDTHNRILLERMRALDTMGYDVIVMAQVSMRALLPDLTDLKTPVLTSFYSGLDAVARKLNEIAEKNN